MRLLSLIVRNARTPAGFLAYFVMPQENANIADRFVRLVMGLGLRIAQLADEPNTKPISAF